MGEITLLQIRCLLEPNAKNPRKSIQENRLQLFSCLNLLDKLDIMGQNVVSRAKARREESKATHTG